ncbi:hypothetical protein C7M84_013610 [Penaeus vannamei]|uniref:Uncharacterized protein n=1 Tax=Penaeus vannamei TaxID=6689 RepID=A0A423SVU3_PENVA|nr:hypothetical protein C7M84_013610 [Penaeus vannamei]
MVASQAPSQLSEELSSCSEEGGRWSWRGGGLSSSLGFLRELASRLDGTPLVLPRTPGTPPFRPTSARTRCRRSQAPLGLLRTPSCGPVAQRCQTHSRLLIPALQTPFQTPVPSDPIPDPHPIPDPIPDPCPIRPHSRPLRPDPPSDPIPDPCPIRPIPDPLSHQTPFQTPCPIRPPFQIRPQTHSPSHQTPFQTPYHPQTPCPIQTPFQTPCPIRPHFQTPCPIPIPDLSHQTHSRPPVPSDPIPPDPLSHPPFQTPCPIRPHSRPPIRPPLSHQTPFQTPCPIRPHSRPPVPSDPIPDPLSHQTPFQTRLSPAGDKREATTRNRERCRQAGEAGHRSSETRAGPPLRLLSSAFLFPVGEGLGEERKGRGE